MPFDRALMGRGRQFKEEWGDLSCCPQMVRDSIFSLLIGGNMDSVSTLQRICLLITKMLAHMQRRAISCH